MSGDVHDGRASSGLASQPGLFGRGWSPRRDGLIALLLGQIRRMSSSAWPAEIAPAPSRSAGVPFAGDNRKLDLSPPSQAWTGPNTFRPVGKTEELVRRAADIVVSTISLLVLSPILGLVALAVYATSEGPALYLQERVGRHGTTFSIVKFRTMRVDAEVGGPRWATTNDPRVTPIGRFLRLTRLDELPQLFNVLAGSMTIVGPRPERPAFVQQLRAAIPHFDDRTLVKPGITGWAQVNYPYGASIEDSKAKLSYDLYYLKHRSVQLEVWILLKTIRTMLLCCGAR